MDLSSSDKDQGAGLLPLPPKSRPRNAPPPPPPTYARHHSSSSNNSNQCTLIDITQDSLESPVKCQFEDNFEPLVALEGSADSADTSKRKTQGTELLEEYGLYFNKLDISQPSSLPVAPLRQGSVAPAQGLEAPASQKLVRNSSALSDLLSMPLMNVTNSSFESAPGPSAPSNPFASSQPPVPHQPSANPFQTPLAPSKTASLSADPFAALVSIQKTNISPVNKDSPGIPRGKHVFNELQP